MPPPRLENASESIRISVSPPSLSFGPQATGTSSSPQTITITNSGTWNLTVSGIAVQGDFSETNNCGSPIAPQGTCNIQVVFSPTASGLRQGVLTLTDNAANSPQTIALAGNTDFSLVIAFNSSSSATVVAGQTATYSLNLNTSPGFSGSVALNCTGAPMGANCIVPNSVSGATPSFTVSVSTTAHASARLHDLDHLGSSALLSATALLGMVVLIPPKRKSKRVLLRLKLLPLLLFLVTFLGSCSGGGTMQSSSMGTPAGNYTLTVTGKSGASSSAVALTLTVQ